MVFSSHLFLLLFLPLSLGSYYFAPPSWRKPLLLLQSLGFYALGEGLLVLAMIACILLNYGAARLMQAGNKRSGLALAVGGSLLPLAYYKYAGFLASNLQAASMLALDIPLPQLQPLLEVALPVGISFYTFQTLSYSLDVYAGRVAASRNLLDFSTYVSMYPQLVAGPIVRYTEVAEQLQDLSHRPLPADGLALGMERFVRGLAKKAILANGIGAVADQIFSFHPHDLGTAAAWTGMLAYGLQLYFDFSGYSDMAVGLGQAMGLRFPENFRYPYSATSLQDFWRRWHITLSGWFRDYLYLPMGGSRQGKLRTLGNLLLVFAATGLWHGPQWTFLAWGLWHGLWLLLERAGLQQLLTRLPRPLSHVYTLLVVGLGWVLFRAPSFEQAGQYMQSLFRWEQGAIDPAYLWDPAQVALLGIGIVFCLPVSGMLKSRLLRLQAGESIYALLLCILAASSLLLLGSSAYNPFIYFRF